MWLFWVLLILAIAWVIKSFTGNNDRPSQRDKTALEILQQRYARGEIDQAEFERKRKDLQA